MVSGRIKMLVQALDDLHTARHTSAAAVTIYIYDILITLDLEVEHIWSSLSFNLPTLLYMTNRYICLGLFLVPTYNIAGFHGDFSDEYCRSPVNLVGFLLAYIGWATILTLRACALWAQRRILVKFIWFVWASSMGGIVATSYISYKEIIVTMRYNSFIRICSPEADKSRIVAATFVGPATLELFLTVLVLIKAFDFEPRPFDFATPTLYRVLARDGVACYVASMILSIGNMVAFFRLPGSQTYLVLYLYWALVTMLIARLVLNLKIVHRRDLVEQGAIVTASNGITFMRQDTAFIMGEGALGADTINPPARAARAEQSDESGGTPTPLKILNTVRRKSDAFERPLGNLICAEGQDFPRFGRVAIPLKVVKYSADSI